MTTRTRLRLAEAAEQGASGNGLDGLAQAHFVGQQRALGEGQVEHAFTLVREERDVGLVQRPVAALDFEFVLAPEPLAFLGAAARLEPQLEFL